MTAALAVAAAGLAPLAIADLALRRSNRRRFTA